jgi:hypothetical protein
MIARSLQMKIAEEGALTDFDRRTGRPQTERGRDLAPKKKYLGDEERSQLDKLTDQYGSYANIPKQFKAQFKEGKGIKSMITRERLEEILREELAAVAEGTPDMSWRDEKPDPVDLISLTPPAAASKPAADGKRSLRTGAIVKPWQLPGLLPADEGSEIEEDATLTELLNLLEGHMGQEAPPVENDQRARELLDGFKNMLKPQERAEPSACATFLRQLADMAEREGGAPDAGTMPEPLPNN